MIDMCTHARVEGNADMYVHEALVDMQTMHRQRKVVDVHTMFTWVTDTGQVTYRRHHALGRGPALTIDMYAHVLTEGLKAQVLTCT